MPALRIAPKKIPASRTVQMANAVPLLAQNAHLINRIPDSRVPETDIFLTRLIAGSSISVLSQ
jgi:hypothetical protein